MFKPISGYRSTYNLYHSTIFADQLQRRLLRLFRAISGGFLCGLPKSDARATAVLVDELGRPAQKRSPKATREADILSFCAAYLDHDAAKAELKKLMPEDAKAAIGHGVHAKRSKSGAVSFDLFELEAGDAALQ
jgi:hypothetical protein